MKRTRSIAVVCLFTMVLSMLCLNINISHAAVKKAKLQKITLQRKPKKEKMVFKISSFVKKNVKFSFDAEKHRGTILFKKIHAKSFRQRLKNVNSKIAYLRLDKFSKIKYKVVKKKRQRYGNATVYLYSAENVCQTMKKTKTGIIVTAENNATELMTEEPTATPTSTPDVIPSVTPDISESISPSDDVGVVTTMPPWSPNPEVYPTFEPAEVSGKKLKIRSEAYYHKIIVPDSLDASASFKYSLKDGVYVTKIELSKMTKTFADQLEINYEDLTSVSCEKTGDKLEMLTLLSSKRLACYLVKTETESQIWVSSYLPENMYHNSSVNQAKMILEGTTMDSVMSAGNYDVTYNLSEDRTHLTLSGSTELLNFQEYDMVYENGKISRVIVDENEGTVTVDVYFSEPMYLRVKNDKTKNKCTLFLYNDVKMSKNYCVVLDAGHGGKDNGATATYKNSKGEYITVDEKSINLDVILRVNTILTSKGLPTVLTRDSDKYVSLQDRVKIANKSGANMFVSVHQNSYETATARGTETYYCESYTPNKNGFDSKSLAERVQKQLIITLDRDTNILDRGVKTADFYVIKNTSMPAILAELAFISNAKDRKCLMDDDFRQKAAQAIADSIEMEFFK